MKVSGLIDRLLVYEYTMKIGYLLQEGVPEIRYPPYSGPAHHVRRVIEELQKLGNEVTLLARLDGCLWTSTDLANFKRVVVPRFDQNPVRLVERMVRRVQYELRLPYFGWFESQRFASACLQILRGSDVLFERMGWLGYGGGLAAKRLGRPLVLEVNGDHLSEMELLGIAPRGMQKRISTALTKSAVHRASYVVATGNGWRKRFLERWDADPSRIEVVENGSDLVERLERPHLRAFQDQTVESEQVTIVYLGAFEPWHGITILLRAMAMAVNSNPNLRLVLIGTGSQENEIRVLTEELGLLPFTRFTGLLPPNEFARELTMADIGVAPYCGRSEYSGLKLIDYKAAALAVLASGEKGQPAVLDHGRTGWIVPPCDENALAEALMTLAKDQDLRKRMGRAARREAEQKHSWQNTAIQLERVFSLLVNSGGYVP